MVLVDTSAWVEFFRGRGAMAPRVDGLLEGGEVCVCGPVLLELRRGLTRERERRQVLALMEGCLLLEQPVDLWNEAGELGAFLGRRGATVKSLDLLIATYALSHSVALLTTDSDFAAMKKAGVPLLLA